MTAKRFKKDRGTFWNNDKRLNMEETVEILNALHEENEQLRKENKLIKETLSSIVFDNKNVEIMTKGDVE